MARVGIYLETATSERAGGAQTSAAVLAGWLAKTHDVELLVPSDRVSLAALAQTANVCLDDVALRSHGGELGRRHDVIVAYVHELPPRHHADLGVLMTLFPLHGKHRFWPWCDRSARRPRWWRSLRERWYERRWRSRFAGYAVCTANSAFTARWTRERWGVDAAVVYPAVDVPEAPVALERKHDMIVSVGRFATRGVRKHQPEMISAFGALAGLRREGWTYRTLGAIGDDDDAGALHDACRNAGGPHVRIETNVDWPTVDGAYRDARFFWHAAGLAVDEASEPEHVEHFGMVTVEAMARGAIPIVVAKGGQPEIVRHGENGILWSTLDELVEATAELAANPARQAELARAAMRDAARFSREAFITRMHGLLSPHLACHAG
jgi:glycosyltransferase involved in cell wall biosynthesis